MGVVLPELIDWRRILTGDGEELKTLLHTYSISAGDALKRLEEFTVSGAAHCLTPGEHAASRLHEKIRMLLDWGKEPEFAADVLRLTKSIAARYGNDADTVKLLARVMDDRRAATSREADTTVAAVLAEACVSETADHLTRSAARHGLTNLLRAQPRHLELAQAAIEPILESFKSGDWQVRKLGYMALDDVLANAQRIRSDDLLPTLTQIVEAESHHAETIPDSAHKDVLALGNRILSKVFDRQRLQITAQTLLEVARAARKAARPEGPA